MDALSAFVPLIMKFWWVFALTLLVGVTGTSWFKGHFGEFVVRFMCRFRLDKNQYHAFHNVMLATPDGTTQIDHIFVSPYGLFVSKPKT